MNEKELSKDELLREIDKARVWLPVEVHTQLKQIVEAHEDVAAWMDKCHELELEVARLKQEKAEVGDVIAEKIHKMSGYMDAEGIVTYTVDKEDIKKLLSQVEPKVGTDAPKKVTR